MFFRIYYIPFERSSVAPDDYFFLLSEFLGFNHFLQNPDRPLQYIWLGIQNTIIGENTYIDNQVHIAHNVVIGKNCIIAGQVGFAGSSKLGDNVKIGGQAGISGHLSIGNNVSIGGGSGVVKNITC